MASKRKSTNAETDVLPQPAPGIGGGIGTEQCHEMAINQIDQEGSGGDLDARPQLFRPVKTHSLFGPWVRNSGGINVPSVYTSWDPTQKKFRWTWNIWVESQGGFCVDVGRGEPMVLQKDPDDDKLKCFFGGRNFGIISRGLPAYDSDLAAKLKAAAIESLIRRGLSEEDFVDINEFFFSSPTGRLGFNFPEGWAPFPASKTMMAYAGRHVIRHILRQETLPVGIVAGGMDVVDEDIKIVYHKGEQLPSISGQLNPPGSTRELSVPGQTNDNAGQMSPGLIPLTGAAAPVNRGKKVLRVSVR